MSRLSLLSAAALLVSVLGLCSTVCAQSSSQPGPPAIGPLLEQMLTGNADQRTAAFWTIYAIPHATARPEVQRVLVEVLQREDDAVNAPSFSADPGNEGYAEYVSQLGEVVYRYAKLVDSEDHAALVALMEEPGGVGNAVIQWLATRTALHVSDAITFIAKSRDEARPEGRGMLVQMLLAGRAGKRAMTAQTAELARSWVLAGLHEASTYSRISTVISIGRLGDPDNAKYLETIAIQDPDPNLRRSAAHWAAKLAKQPPVHHIGQ